MFNKIRSFLKKFWEYIVLGVGIIAAYLIYMDPARVEDFDYRDGTLEGKSEKSEEDRKEAKEKKSKAEDNLDELKEEEKRLEEKLKETPQHKGKSKEELREWMRERYGS